MFYPAAFREELFLKKIIKNNKGFSLIELLVGIAILGIIVAPLLSNFVVSANIFSRSREIGEATTAAQNISENMKEAEFSYLLANPTLLGDAEFTVNNNIENASNYTMEIENIQSGTSTFSANVTFTAGEVSETDATVTLFESINSQEILNFTIMDAMFSQDKFLVNGYGYNLADDSGSGDDVRPLSTLETTSDPDYIVLHNVKVAEAARRGVEIETLDNPEVERRIIIEIENIGPEDIPQDTTNNTIIAKVIYEYTFMFGTDTLADSTDDFTYSTATHRELCTIEFPLLTTPYDVAAHNSDRPILYVLYHPHYASSSIIDAAYSDKIIIRNNVDLSSTPTIDQEERLPLDIYIIKQVNTDMLEAELRTAENSYRALIELVQPFSATEPAAAHAIKIYSNAGITFEGNEATAPIFRWYNGASAYYTTTWEQVPPTLSVAEGAQAPTSSAISNVEQKYRMYEVAIDIINEHGETVHTLNTSKLA